MGSAYLPENAKRYKSNTSRQRQKIAETHRKLRSSELGASTTLLELAPWQILAWNLLLSLILGIVQVALLFRLLLCNFLLIAVKLRGIPDPKYKSREESREDRGADNTETSTQTPQT